MTAFRDAIAGAANDAWGVEGGRFIDEDVADAVLAMPEMQAIRKALHMSCAFSVDNFGLTNEDRMAIMDTVFSLPLEVCLWVLDGDS